MFIKSVKCQFTRIIAALVSKGLATGAVYVVERRLKSIGEEPSSRWSFSLLKDRNAEQILLNIAKI